MQVRFGQAYQLNQVTLNGQQPSEEAREKFFGYPVPVLKACADHLEINRPEEQTPAVLKSHHRIKIVRLDKPVRPTDVGSFEYVPVEKRDLILTREDAVLLNLVEKINGFAYRPGRENTEVDFNAPAFEKDVEELRRYGIDAAAHFAAKGLKTYQQFADAYFDIEQQTEIPQESSSGCALVLDKPTGSGKQGAVQRIPDRWMDALKKILNANPAQATKIDVDFEPTTRGHGYQVKKLDLLNV